MSEQLQSIAPIAFFVVLPILAVVCFLAGIVLGGRCPVWLLLVAAMVPLGYALTALFWSVSDGIDWFALVGLWMALAFAILIWAMIAARRGRPYRRLSSLLGLAMSLPVAACALVVLVSVM